MPVWGYVLEQTASSSSGSAKRAKTAMREGPQDVDSDQAFVRLLRLAAGVTDSSQIEGVTHIEQKQEIEEGEEPEEDIVYRRSVSEDAAGVDPPLAAESTPKDKTSHIEDEAAEEGDEIDMDALAKKLARKRVAKADRPLANRAGARTSKATQTEHPQWNAWDPKRWLWVLEDAGCDKLAQTTWLSMARLPHDEDFYHANQIVSYLRCKDVADPSMLVHKWALDADRKVKFKLSWDPRV